MTEEEFMLADRIAKIKSINELHDLENNAYVAFSGGKDSTVLHYLIDEAIPGNKIPRLHINTGIEFLKIENFVKDLSKSDSRIIIQNSGVNIKSMLDEKGYPFKSKLFSHNVKTYQNIGLSKSVLKFLNLKAFGCPEKLRYCFTNDFKIKVSENCCNELKKKPAHKWCEQNKRFIQLTGLRLTEGGGRKVKGQCTVFNSGKLKSFNPLFIVNEKFLNWYVEYRNIKLCELYYPPYNFERTGCKGCPFNLNLQEDLDVMENLLPGERKQCELIWKPVYDEYRRIGYRLRDRGPFDLL